MLITTPDNGVYVAYRGTDNGEGYDNAEMMYKESTLQQQEALEYFESLVENEKHSDLFINGNVKLYNKNLGD